MKNIRELGADPAFSRLAGKRLQEQQTHMKGKNRLRQNESCFLGSCRLQLAGLGDVGQNVAIGLTLLGGRQIDTIGLYDLNTAQVQRMETELSQFAPPPGGERLPRVYAVREEELFDCDVFLFCATKAVPEVGSEAGDVRMAQYEANKKIVGLYGQMASDRNYAGLFLVISDPVDLLCMEVLRRGSSLHPEQIRGCGLGVMNARGRYYAAGEPEFSSYLTEGRAFGPHGKDLVLANSLDPKRYDPKISEALTERAVHANLEVRKLGFKPYLAPAMSSAVFTILAMLKGEWNYSAAWLNGLYFGALNRLAGPELLTEWEEMPLPEHLFHRLEKSYGSLEEILWS
jgi:malate/lactate dehydrogenase